MKMISFGTIFMHIAILVDGIIADESSFLVESLNEISISMFQLATCNTDNTVAIDGGREEQANNVCKVYSNFKHD